MICRERRGSQDWEIILSVPEECEVKGVLHNGTPLLGEAGEYRPQSFSGVLVVEYAGGASEEVPLIGDTPFIIFKLRSEWQGDGRRTRATTRGHFIVIAPTEWTRTGRPPVEAAGCADARYTAHFFFNQPGGETSGVGGFEESALPTAEAGYALQGTRVHDDSESGDMFVGDAPTLEPASGIVWARVGEEAQCGWKGQSFKPAEDSLRGVLGGRQGRFYIRVYDESTALVDSGEFRYSTNLREIRVNGEPYSADMLLAPAPEGHSPASLSFVGVDGAAVSAELMVANDHVTVAPGGVATVAPHPDGDETTWSLEPGSSMDVVIRLPRIWWRMVVPDVSPGGWRDRVISMSRDEFREQSQANAKMEVHLPPSVKGMRAGFKHLDQSFPAERAEGNFRRVILPLNAFVDYEEIDRPSTKNVYLKIRCDKVEFGLVHVIPDPPPPRPESPRTQERRRGQRRGGIRRDGRGQPGRRGPKSRRDPERPRIPERIPVMERPRVPKKPLVPKNPQRRYHLNVPGRGAALFTLVARTKCDQHVTDNERSTSYKSLEKHIGEVRECCASTADYLTPGRPLKDAVFRVILSKDNRPLTAQQISNELNERWPNSRLNLSPWAIEKILDSDPKYLNNERRKPKHG